jgi:peptidoglycan/LPS O-acetylase OafA/YrhL
MLSRDVPAPPVFQPPPGNPRFPLFDSLRGIAVLCVFTTHATIAAQANLTDYGRYTMRLELALTIFFIVSGFLLYRPYLSAHINGTRAPKLADYARNRVLRIVPAYWVALTILAIYPGLGGFWTDHSWTYYLFLQEYDYEWSRGGILPTWSLTVEVVFYSMLPLLAWVMTRPLLAGKSRAQKIRGELALLVGLYASGIVYRVIVRDQIGDDPTSNLWALLPGSIDWLAIGMLLALASVVLQGREQQPLPVRVVERWPGISWAVMLVLFWVVATQIGRTGDFPEQTTPEQWIWTHVLYGVICALLVVPAVFGDRRGGLPRRVLRNRVLAWFGLISYGMFIWHHPVTLELAKVDAFADNKMLWVWTVGLAISAALGAASYYIVERPFLRLKRTRLTPRPESPLGQKRPWYARASP